MSKNEESQKYLESLRPDIERLVRRVDGNKHAFITGIIFSENPPAIAHITSIDNRGDDLIKLHMSLSAMIAELYDNNPFFRMPFQEFSMGPFNPGDVPEEIADELARMVLVTSMDESRANLCMQLAQRYIQSRGKNGPDKV